jgi:hypothetical protein
MDLSDPVLELRSFDFIFDLAIPKNSFQGDELPLLKSLGEPGEISPGIDAMPFGAVLVVALVCSFSHSVSFPDHIICRDLSR